jgi:hypothetical protein
MPAAGIRAVTRIGCSPIIFSVFGFEFLVFGCKPKAGNWKPGPESDSFPIFDNFQ